MKKKSVKVFRPLVSEPTAEHMAEVEEMTGEAGARREREEAEKRPAIVYKRAKMYAKQEACFFNEARYSLTEGSSKAGKTVGLIIWLVEQAVRGKEGQNYWWIAPVAPTAAIAYRRACKAIPYNLRTTHDTLQRITLINGTHIWFKGSEKPDSLYGEDVYACAIDEASRCFMAGTLVDTPHGPMAIETIGVGDAVVNACGVGQVTRTIVKQASAIAVVMVKGRKIVCSHDHRFFTARGWVEAQALTEGDTLVLASEAMRILRKRFCAVEQMPAVPAILQPAMFLRRNQVEKGNTGLCLVQPAVHGGRVQTADEAFLHAILRDEVAAVGPGAQGQDSQQCGGGENTRQFEEMVVAGHGTDESHEGRFGGEKRDASTRGEGENVPNDEGAGDSSEATGWKRERHARGAKDAFHGPRDRILSGTFRGLARRGNAVRLQDRHCPRSHENGGGGGWAFPRFPQTPGFGSTEGQAPFGPRVDSVEIHESGSDEFNAISGGKDYITLHDLSVSGHPSFSVEGVLVHNCREQSFHAVRSTVTATRGQIRAIGNVRGRRNWFYKLCRKAEAGEPDMSYHKLTWHDAVKAGVLDHAEIEDARNVLPPMVFKELYEAEAGDDAGNPFGMDAIAECVTEMSSDPVVVWGQDFARKANWNVGIGLDRLGRVCRLERFQKPWREAIADMVTYLRGTPTLCDSTGMGDVIIDALQQKLPAVEGYWFTQKSKQMLMENLAIGIQQRKIRFPDGVIRNELESFEYTFTRTGVIYTAMEGCEDDAVMALGLAWLHHQKHGGGSFVFDRVPERAQLTDERGGISRDRTILI